MKQTKEEKAAARDQFRQLSLRKKTEHVFLYYKWYILLGLVLLVILGSAIYRFATKKERVLYLGLTNVSVGSELENVLGADFLTYCGLDPRKAEVSIYSDLFLSEDAEGEAHKTAYASRIKLMASVNNQQMDILLMSRQAYDLLSAQGYLMALPELLSAAPELSEATAPLLTENAVVLEDNTIEWQLHETEQHVIRTEQAVNGLRVTDLPRFASSGFSEEVYLGVLANTPRSAACLEYLRYLTAVENQSQQQ